jgi:hypothetical protein
VEDGRPPHRRGDGQVEKLTAWLVRQTGVRLDTLRQHYEKWWPRDRRAIAATYAALDASLGNQDRREWDAVADA